MQDTPSSAAAVGVTLWEDQLAPPSTVVRITPCPVRVPVTVAALVPTVTHQAPGTPGGAVVEVVLGDGTVVGGTVVVGADVTPGWVEAVTGVVVTGVVVTGVVVTGVVVTGVVVDVKGRPP